MFKTILKRKLPLLLLQLWLIVCGLSLVAQPPAGYYSTATGSGATLKTQLYNIIKGHTARTYDNLWTDFQSTDKKANGKVWDMYSDIPGGTPAYQYTFGTHQCGNYNSEGDCYNREHSFPASWFNNASPMYTDLFQLYPTDGYVNNRRSNHPFGEVGTSVTWQSTNGSKLGSAAVGLGYSGTVFEPRDEYKGDFARTYFYMVTRYENLVSGWNSDMISKNTFPSLSNWAMNMLGEWHVNDPVSQKEIDRNNAVYAIQGNRNPFIDNPNYVYQIWGVGNSTTVTEPLAHAVKFSPYFIDLQWNDAAGSTAPAGYLIRYSSSGFGDIETPTDGIVYLESTDIYVLQGTQNFRVKGLSAGTTYYFKLFPYTGSGTSINYKTDGVVPQISREVN